MFIKIKSRQVSLHRVFTKSVFFSIGEGVLEGGCTHMLHRRVLHGAMALVTTNFAQHARTRDSRGGAAVARNRAAINKTGVSKGVRGKRGRGRRRGVREPGALALFLSSAPAHRRMRGVGGGGGGEERCDWRLLVGTAELGVQSRTARTVLLYRVYPVALLGLLALMIGQHTDTHRYTLEIRMPRG